MFPHDLSQVPSTVARPKGLALEPPQGVPSRFIPETKRLSNDDLEARVSERLDFINDYLNDDNKSKLLAKLDKASLKDVSIAEGILIDKLLVLRGEPNQVIGVVEQQRLDDLVPALLAEMRKRGLKATLTERQAEITIGSSGEAANPV